MSYFSRAEVAAMLKHGIAVDGNGGGLLIGRSHAEGGIPVLMSLASGGYQLHAEFEGYEYLLNQAAVFNSRMECEQANQPELDRRSEFVPYTPEEGTTLLDVRADNHPIGTKYLVLTTGLPFFMVNRHSTKIRLSALEAFNRTGSQKR